MARIYIIEIIVSSELFTSLGYGQRLLILTNNIKLKTSGIWSKDIRRFQSWANPFSTSQYTFSFLSLLIHCFYSPTMIFLFQLFLILSSRHHNVLETKIDSNKSIIALCVVEYYALISSFVKDSNAYYCQFSILWCLVIKLQSTD